jgi:hypothetical protein
MALFMSSTTKSKLQASRKKGRELEFFVYPNMAKAANEKIHHQANSASLNLPAPHTYIFLNIIGCSIGPYLWMDGNIRPSNVNITSHVKRTL